MKDNKLIAEFMGMTEDSNDKSVMIQITPQGNEVVPIESMEYHKSWDWLMPVVDKIEGTETENGYYDVRLYVNATTISQSLLSKRRRY